MPRYTITEPHPTVPKDSYTHSGRGGAGNTFRVSSATTQPSGVPSAPRAQSSSSSSRFYSGRGGAGNAHAAMERPVLSFDEEFASAAAREQAHAGHVGRGGAGNVFSGSSSSSSSSKSARKSSDARSARSSSSSSSGSVRAGFWGRISGASLGHH